MMVIVIHLMDVICVNFNVKMHVWIVMMVSVINVKKDILMINLFISVYQHVEIRSFKEMNNVMMEMIIYKMDVINVNLYVIYIVSIV